MLTYIFSLAYMNTDGISVVVNTYNAEKHLARVLEAVKGFDEVVVCDMESTDGTLDIARRFGCRIVTFPKGQCTIVEPARQFAIDRAKCKWVLVVDADEIVTEELRDYLYNIIRSEDCPQGLFLARKNFFMGRFIHSTYPDYILRFFVREGTGWPPYIHTSPIVKGRIDKIPAKRKELALVHLAENSVKDRFEKTNTYTENEVEKKAGKRYGIGALLYRPAFRFFKSYVLKRGFLDGTAGFVYACLEGIYQFAIVSKMMERRRQR